MEVLSPQLNSPIQIQIEALIESNYYCQEMNGATRGNDMS